MGPQGPSGPTTGGSTGTGASSTAQLTDFAPTVSNGILTVQPGVHVFNSLGYCGYTTTSTASATVTGGPGIGKLYLADTCALVLQYPSSMTITWAASGITASSNASPQLPQGTMWIGDVHIGVSGITSVDDKRAQASTPDYQATDGVRIDCTLGPCLISADANMYRLGGVNVVLGTHDATSATQTKPNRVITADPTDGCSNANQYEVIVSAASNSLWLCNGTWHKVGQ